MTRFILISKHRDDKSELQCLNPVDRYGLSIPGIRLGIRSNQLLIYCFNTTQYTKISYHTGMCDIKCRYVLNSRVEKDAVATLKGTTYDDLLFPPHRREQICVKVLKETVYFKRGVLSVI